MPEIGLERNATVLIGEREGWHIEITLLEVNRRERTAVLAFDLPVYSRHSGRRKRKSGVLVLKGTRRSMEMRSLRLGGSLRMRRPPLLIGGELQPADEVFVTLSKLRKSGKKVTLWISSPRRMAVHFDGRRRRRQNEYPVESGRPRRLRGRDPKRSWFE